MGEALDDDSEAVQDTRGKHKFNNLLKDLMQRIEFGGGLAPVEDYGRHMQKMLKKKRKKAAASGAEGGDVEMQNEQVQDENYYDLDDNFIDDGEIIYDYDSQDYQLQGLSDDEEYGSEEADEGAEEEEVAEEPEENGEDEAFEDYVKQTFKIYSLEEVQRMAKEKHENDAIFAEAAKVNQKSPAAVVPGEKKRPYE